MIHNAFEISMNGRIHQLGILQSVGAAPKQIKSFLLQEAMILCAIPIVLGIAVGVGASYFLMQTVIFLTGDIRTYELTFQFHFLVVMISFLASGLTMLISAWIPVRKISRLTPLAALGYGIETDIAKMRKFHIFSRLFGVYGELARKSLYARRKELRTSTLSLAFAFLALTGLLNIEAISDISTQFTYFERFRDKWDIMLTTADHDENLLEQISETEGVKSCIAYQKAVGETYISERFFSMQLQQIGIQNLKENFVDDSTGAYRFDVPLYVLDDASFAAYCRENQLEEKGVVAVNKIWNSMSSSRKNREYLPIVNEETPLTLEVAGNRLEISAYADELPRIKEEFQQYSMSLVLSESFFQAIQDTIPVTQTIYNIFLVSEEVDEKVQEQIRGMRKEYASDILESRVEEEHSEYKIRKGMKIFVYCFAGFLAGIGVINMFSFTLGQIYQRRKEFARYLSVGLSPRGMWRILAMEAVVIALKPFLLSLIINVPLVAAALQAAEISFSEYVVESPLCPIGIFTLAVFLFILLAYYLGGRRICSGDLTEVIKDETLL